MTREVVMTEYAQRIVAALPKGGVLFTTKAGDQVDTMTIGWGAVGVNWAKPVFTAYIRTGRHTASLLKKNPEFTVNVPDQNTNRKILGYCGSRSGRNEDKIAGAGLTLVEPQIVSVPAIAELPLTLECKVLYMQEQVIADLLPEEQQWYPQDVPSENCMANCDNHITVWGQIVAAYEL